MGWHFVDQFLYCLQGLLDLLLGKASGDEKCFHFFLKQAIFISGFSDFQFLLIFFTFAWMCFGLVTSKSLISRKLFAANWAVIGQTGVFTGPLFWNLEGILLKQTAFTRSALFCKCVLWCIFYNNISSSYNTSFKIGDGLRWYLFSIQNMLSIGLCARGLTLNGFNILLVDGNSD